MGAPRVPYMAKTDKERLATGFWNRIESNQAADCNRTVFGKAPSFYQGSCACTAIALGSVGYATHHAGVAVWLRRLVLDL